MLYHHWGDEPLSKEALADIERIKINIRKAKALVDKAVSLGIKGPVEYEKWKKNYLKESK